MNVKYGYDSSPTTKKCHLQFDLSADSSEEIVAVPIKEGDWVVGGSLSDESQHGCVHRVLNRCGDMPFCQMATPEEIEALPIKEGDWVVGTGAVTMRRSHPCNRVHKVRLVVYCEREPKCRHATPDEYRAAVSESSGQRQAPEPLRVPDDVAVDAFAEIDVTTTSNTGPDDPEVIHYHGKIDTGPKSGLEQSGDDGERALVTKALEEHSTRLDQIEAEVSPNTLKARMETDRAIREDTAKRTHNRLDALEAEPAAPVEPELPPLLKNRIDGAAIEGPFILVHDTPDDSGQLGYFRGRCLSGSKTDQGCVRLWAATLIPVKPEPEVPAATLDALRARAAAEVKAADEAGYLRGKESRRKRWWHVDPFRVAVAAWALIVVALVGWAVLGIKVLS